MAEETVTERAKRQRREWDELLAKTADAALENHPDSIQRAGEEMAGMVRRDPRLRDAVLELIVDSYCHERCRKVQQAKNSALWREDARPTAGDDPTGRLISALRTERKLMEYALMGGKKLGDATREDVLRNARFQNRQSLRMAQTGLWLALIADQMADSRPRATVSESFSESELLHLKKLAISNTKATVA